MKKISYFLFVMYVLDIKISPPDSISKHLLLYYICITIILKIVGTSQLFTRDVTTCLQGAIISSNNI